MKSIKEYIESSFHKYYETEFASELEDSNRNRELRREAISALKKALEESNTELAEAILKIISKNTGCEEDLSLFYEFIAPLEQSGLITKGQINIVTNSKGLKRWQ